MLTQKATTLFDSNVQFIDINFACFRIFVLAKNWYFLLQAFANIKQIDKKLLKSDNK